MPKRAKDPAIEELSKKMRDHVHHRSRISLWLDNYDEIFSDFDPRPFGKKSLSDDFLSEAMKVGAEVGKKTSELTLLIPKSIRNPSLEKVIKKRLIKHFKEEYDKYLQEKQAILKRGTFFLILGVVIMFVTAIFFYEHADENIWFNFLVVLLEPAGWFTFWEGLNQIIFDSKEEDVDLKFFEKLSKCSINFYSY